MSITRFRWKEGKKWRVLETGTVGEEKLGYILIYMLQKSHNGNKGAAADRFTRTVFQQKLFMMFTRSIADMRFPVRGERHVCRQRSPKGWPWVR